jgi:hypothetical protein
MRMMQPAVYEVIEVVAMRYCLVSAIWAVRVRAAVLRRAAHGINGIDRDGMFVDVVLVHMVQMTVVDVIYMAVMPNCGMAAARAMLMQVVGMVLLNASGHFPAPSRTVDTSRNLPPASASVITFVRD